MLNHLYLAVLQLEKISERETVFPGSELLHHFFYSGHFDAIAKS